MTSSAAVSLDAAIDARIDRKLAELRAPSLEWAPAASVNLTARQARRLTSKGLRIARLGKILWIHVPTLDRILAASQVPTPAPSPEAPPAERPRRGTKDLAEAFGVTRRTRPQKGATR